MMTTSPSISESSWCDDALQAAQQVAADVLQVVAALAQVGVVDAAAKRSLELLGGLVHRPLGVDVLARGCARSIAAEEAAVGEQQDVGVEDRRPAPRRGLAGTCAGALSPARVARAARLVRRCDLGLDLVLGEREAVDLGRRGSAMHDGAADGDAVARPRGPRRTCISPAARLSSPRRSGRRSGRRRRHAPLPRPRPSQRTRQPAALRRGQQQDAEDALGVDLLAVLDQQ